MSIQNNVDLNFDTSQKFTKTLSANMAVAKLYLVRQLITSDSIVIFSKTYCPYCRVAKDLFDKLDQRYSIIELDQRKDGSEIQNVLGKLTGCNTVPRIFFNGECLGGASDVQAMYESGTLAKYLTELEEDH